LPEYPPAPPGPGPDPTPEPFINPFVDVSETDWFFDHVAFVYQQGLMTGTSIVPRQFSPNMNTTRGMVVQVLYNMMGRPEVDGFVNPFDDVSNYAWYADAVKWAAENNVIAGFGDGSFRPSANITRSHLALILNNFADFAGMELPETRYLQAFNDDIDIRNYARVAVERFFQAEIINGRPGNIFDPQGLATRAEMAAMLHRFLVVASVTEQEHE
jgi:hypothetical protein